MFLSVDTKEQDDGAMYVGTAHNPQHFSRLLVKSIAVMLDRIKDKADTLATDELTNLLYQERFKLSGCKEMVKISFDCQVITQEVVERCK